ncbi:MAG: hypothetical protein JW768_12780 [Chitinispirillaceae bacterium]|nr:hypothetical protein [Chitinispirillaceae bacterium]
MIPNITAIVRTVLFCAAAGAAVFLLYCTAGERDRSSGHAAAFPLMPWQSIKGCGAGGSGGGSSGIKWIGEGVSGGLVEIEVLPKINFSRTFAYSIAVPRITFTPFWNTEVGISMPLGSKTEEVQYQTNMPFQTVMNGGRGDLTCDLMRSFGSIGQYSVQFGLTFPTGQYDAQRGTDLAKSILPQTLQMGQGLYAAALTLYYTRDVDKGMYLFDANVYYPFMFRFDKKNKYLETDYAAYKTTQENRERFYYPYIIKPYGENDRGGYFPPTLGFDAIYAYRGVPKMVQSFQLFFQVPLGVRWTHYYDPLKYDPRPDPTHRAWDAVLAYAIEFSRDAFPLYLGIGLPVHDRRGTPGEDIYDPAPFAKWNAPDWENIGNEWIIAIGFKAAMF